MWRALGTRPWTRAPLLLRRQPPVLLAVAGAAAVLATAAAAPPLFASSVGTAALQRQVAERCATSVAPYAVLAGPLAAGRLDQDGTLVTGAQAITAYAALDARARAALATIPGVSGPVTRTLVIGRGAAERIFTGNSAGAAKGYAAEAAIASSPAALAAVQVLTDAGGDGVLVPDTLAQQASLHAGSTAWFATSAGVTSARVRAIYRDPTPERTLPPALCQLRGLSGVWTSTLEDTAPGVVLADEATLRRLDGVLHYPDVVTYLDQPVDVTHLDLGGADRVIAGLPAAAAAIDTSDSVDLNGQLPEVTTLAHAVRTSVTGATGPVSIAGALVALVLVAGAGAFWLERRRQEVRLLASRGVGPVALGVKAGLEMLPAVAVGTVAGWAFAVLAVRTVGPSSTIEAGVPLTAALHAAALAVAGVLLLGLVGAVGSRTSTERVVGARAGRWRFVPFELMLIAAAVVTAGRLQPAGAQVADGTHVAAIDEGLLAYPLLLLAGSVVLALRILLLALGGTAHRAGRERRGREVRRDRSEQGDRSGQAVRGQAVRERRARGPAGWLATRRVLGSPAIAVSLCAAAALPVGVLVYSTGLTASSRATLAAKTELFIGSVSQVGVVDEGPGGAGSTVRLPAGFTPRSSLVRILSRVTVGGTTVAVRAVDPATFAAVAAWDPTYADRSLPDLMRAITVGRPLAPGEALPVIEVGAAGGLGAAPTLQLAVNNTSVSVPTRVAATARLATGATQAPLLLVDAAAIASIGQTDELQVLSRADVTLLVRSLQAAGFATTFAVDDTRVVSAASFLPITWTFGYLQALAALTGLLTIGAVLLHLEVRQRGRAVAYALSRRMGLSRAAHLRSLLIELAVLLAPGALVGGLIGWVAVVVTHSHLDPTPTLEPGPLLRAPLAAVLGVALGLVAAVAAGALFAQRRADRTDIAAALRG